MSQGSFRWRLVRIAVLTSGLVLFVFGGVVWWTLYQDRMRTIDDELRTFGQLIAGRSGPNVSGQKVEDSMLRDFGGHVITAMRLNDAAGHTLHQSNWPEGLEYNAYPAGQPYMPVQPRLPAPKVNADGRIPPQRDQHEPQFYTASHLSTAWRLGVFSNDHLVLYLGRNLEPTRAELRQLGLAFLLALPAALLIIASGGLLLAQKALRPIDLLSGRMETLSAAGLDQRLEIKDADREFNRMITAFNEMMGRLEKSFHQANRFSSDASHELKTPLAVLQGNIERARAEIPGNDPAQARLADMQLEVSGLLKILKGLLLLSRADAGKLQITRERIQLDTWLEPLLEDLDMLGESGGIVTQRALGEDLAIDADPQLMQQALTNLFTNAVKHNMEGGRIQLSTERWKDGIRIQISNTGSPLNREQELALFERFFQADPARVEGSGLGLSIAREIIEAHGGQLRYQYTAENLHQFEILLPPLLEHSTAP